MITGKIIIYCINLESRISRREQAILEAVKSGFSLVFISAVVGSELEYDQVEEYNRNRRLTFYKDLKLGEVGCNLSHLKAYRAFLESDAEIALVLEDDFVLPEDFNSFIDELSNDYVGWEALRLQRSRKQEGVKIASIGRYDILFPLRVGLKTTACMYTRAGARKAIKVYENFFLPADEAMKFSHFKGLLMYEVNPTIVNQRDGLPSDIGGGQQSPPREKGLLKRLLIKLYYVFGQGVRVFLIPVALMKFRKIRK